MADKKPTEPATYCLGAPPPSRARAFQDWVKSISTLVQAIAVVIGIGFGVVELRSRQADFQAKRSQNSLDIIAITGSDEYTSSRAFLEKYATQERGTGKAMSLDDLRKNTVGWRPVAKRALYCLYSAQCNEDTLKTEFCLSAAMLDRLVSKWIDQEEIFFTHFLDIAELIRGYEKFCPAEYTRLQRFA